jgi:hypothetical protein
MKIFDRFKRKKKQTLDPDETPENMSPEQKRERYGDLLLDLAELENTIAHECFELDEKRKNQRRSLYI